MAIPTLLAQHDGTLAYEDTGAGGTGASSGPLTYAAGHVGGVESALIESAATNYFRNPLASSSNPSGWIVMASASLAWDAAEIPPITGTTHSLAVSVSALAGGVRSIDTPPITAAPGETWTSAVWIKATVECDLYVWFRTAAEGSLGGETVRYSDTGTWQRVEVTATAPASTERVNLQVQTAAGSMATVWLAGGHLVQLPTATSLIPQQDAGGTLLPGYAWTGTEHASTSTRAATSVSYPMASAPAHVAVRYSEDDGATWDVAHVTSLAGTNVGSYGQVSHDDGELVLSSTAGTRFGPVFAFAGTLTSEEQTTLDTTDTWTFDMLTPESSTGQFIIADVTGTDAGAPAITLAGGA